MPNQKTAQLQAKLAELNTRLAPRSLHRMALEAVEAPPVPAENLAEAEQAHRLASHALEAAQLAHAEAVVAIGHARAARRAAWDRIVAARPAKIDPAAIKATEQKIAQDLTAYRDNVAAHYRREFTMDNLPDNYVPHEDEFPAPPEFPADKAEALEALFARVPS